MKAQRGSMAVIALVMMLLLLIVGVAWLPMLAQENQTARNDWEEQQAWYAAEAGFVRAKTELNNSTTGGDWSWLAASNSSTDLTAKLKNITDDVLTGTKQAKYAVYISPSLTATAAPTASTTYAITSVGQVNGVQKILKKTITTAATSTGGGTTTTTTISLPGLIQAGGTVTIENSSNSITGDIYGATFKDLTGNQNPTKNGNYKSAYSGTIATKIPDSVFWQSTYASLTTITPTGQWDNINIQSNGNYLMNWPLSTASGANWYYLLTSTSDVTLFVHSASPITFYTTDGIEGPTDMTKPPLTIIFDNDVILSGGAITGNVRMFVKGTIDYEVNGSKKNKVDDTIMVVANGDITLGRSMQYGLLSSNGSITLNSSCPNFAGQIIAKNNIDIGSSSVTYSDIVSNTTGFVWPSGMQ